MRILAFAASNSLESINRKLIAHAVGLIEGGLLGDDVSVEVLDINDHEMPLYSPEREAEGMPAEAQSFYEAIGNADALVISFAEHNGHYSAAYKNLFDWASRIDFKVYQGKPTVFFSSSPGSKGGASVLAAAVGSSQWFTSDVKASMAFPKFFENFDVNAGTISNAELAAEFEAALRSLVD